MIEERRDQTVYRHIRGDNGQIFYVGRGVPGRATKYGRNPHWENIVKKHGYSVEIVAEGLTVAEANAMEIALIARFGRRNLKTGPLVNMTAGGEGLVDPSPEVRERLSETRRRFLADPVAREKVAEATRLNNPMKRAEVREKNSESQRRFYAENPDAREKQAEAKRRFYAENPDKHPMFGKKHSDETRAKASAATRRYYAENPDARVRAPEAYRTPNTAESPLVGIKVHKQKSGPRYSASLKVNGKCHSGPTCTTLEDARLYRLLLEAKFWASEVAA
jgi:hypothetical protein